MPPPDRPATTSETIRLATLRLDGLAQRIGVVSTALGVKTRTGRSFPHIAAARAREDDRRRELEAERPLSTDVPRPGTEPAEAVVAALKAGPTALPVPVLRRFDSEQPALTVRKKAAPCVLVVDANRLHGAATVISLKRYLSDVRYASSVRDALEVLQQCVVDVALIAAVMPDTDGCVLADLMRHTEQAVGGRAFRTLIIGMLTRDQVDEYGLRDDCLASGMDRYIVKPAMVYTHVLLDAAVVADSSLEGFRRRVIENQWASKHRDVAAALKGTVDQAMRLRELTAIHDGHIKEQRRVLQFYNDEDRGTLQDLLERQRKEEGMRAHTKAAKLNDKVSALQADLVQAQHEQVAQAQKGHALAFVELEKRHAATEQQLAEANHEIQRLQEEREGRAEDLKQLLKEGFANAKKVAAAESRVKRMHSALQLAEERLMEAEDRAAFAAWHNYYGQREVVAAVPTAPAPAVPSRAVAVNAPKTKEPGLVTDSARSWYERLLRTIVNSAKENHRFASAQTEELAGLVSRLQRPKCTVEQLRTDVTDTVDSLCRAHGELAQRFLDSVTGAVAGVLMREVEFWHMVRSDDPDLNREVASLVRANDERRFENTKGCQTASAAIKPIDASDALTEDRAGRGDPSSTFVTGAAQVSDRRAGAGAGLCGVATQLTVRTLLQRLAPVMTSAAYVSPELRTQSYRNIAAAAAALDQHLCRSLHEATSELSQQLHAVADTLRDPYRSVSLAPALAAPAAGAIGTVQTLTDTVQNAASAIHPLFRLASGAGGGGASPNAASAIAPHLRAEYANGSPTRAAAGSPDSPRSPRSPSSPGGVRKSTSRTFGARSRSELGLGGDRSRGSRVYDDASEVEADAAGPNGASPITPGSHRGSGSPRFLVDDDGDGRAGRSHRRSTTRSRVNSRFATDSDSRSPSLSPRGSRAVDVRGVSLVGSELGTELEASELWPRGAGDSATDIEFGVQADVAGATVATMHDGREVREMATQTSLFAGGYGAPPQIAQVAGLNPEGVRRSFAQRQRSVTRHRSTGSLSPSVLDDAAAQALEQLRAVTEFRRRASRGLSAVEIGEGFGVDGKSVVSANPAQFDDDGRLIADGKVTVPVPTRRVSRLLSTEQEGLTDRLKRLEEEAEAHIAAGRSSEAEKMRREMRRVRQTIAQNQAANAVLQAKVLQRQRVNTISQRSGGGGGHTAVSPSSAAAARAMALGITAADADPFQGSADARRSRTLTLIGAGQHPEGPGDGAQSGPHDEHAQQSPHAASMLQIGGGATTSRQPSVGATAAGSTTQTPARGIRPLVTGLDTGGRGGRPDVLADAGPVRSEEPAEQASPRAGGRGLRSPSRRVGSQALESLVRVEQVSSSNKALLMETGSGTPKATAETLLAQWSDTHGSRAASPVPGRPVARDQSPRRDPSVLGQLSPRGASSVAPVAGLSLPGDKDGKEGLVVEPTSRLGVQAPPPTAGASSMLLGRAPRASPMRAANATARVRPRPKRGRLQRGPNTHPDADTHQHPQPLDGFTAQGDQLGSTSPLQRGPSQSQLPPRTSPMRSPSQQRRSSMHPQAPPAAKAPTPRRRDSIPVPPDEASPFSSGAFLPSSTRRASVPSLPQLPSPQLPSPQQPGSRRPSTGPETAESSALPLMVGRGPKHSAVPAPPSGAKSARGPSHGRPRPAGPAVTARARPRPELGFDAEQRVADLKRSLGV